MMHKAKKFTDKCGCKCCSNGIVATIAVNILLWTALLFSGGALIDCHMVEADIQSNNWPSIPNILLGLTDGQQDTINRRGFGFFIHEDNNGSCRWEYWDDESDNEDWTSEDADEIEDYVEDYVDWMGRDWRRAAKVGISATIFGLGLAVVAGIFACVTNAKWVRWLAGGLALLVVAPLQWGTLAVMNSDFCQERNCELQRSGHFAIAAGFLYLAAAVGFFFMKNCSGNSDSQAENQGKEQPDGLVLEEATHQDEEADYTLEPAETQIDSEKNDNVETRMENVRIV